MGLGVGHLNTDVVRPRIQMVLHTSAHRIHVTPCDERLYQVQVEAIGVLTNEVVAGPASSRPVP